jgi:hypothetical protein
MLFAYLRLGEFPDIAFDAARFDPDQRRAVGVRSTRFILLISIFLTINHVIRPGDRIKAMAPEADALDADFQRCGDLFIPDAQGQHERQQHNFPKGKMASA